MKQDATTREISVAAATDGTAVTFANASGASRTLSGVADGELSATSNQAVNGSQLFATNARVSTNTTNLGNVASSLGGGAGIAPDGSWTAPDYAVQGGNYANVGAALGALDTATTGNSTAITNLQTQLNEGAVGLVKQDATTREILVAAATDGTAVTFANASGASRTLSGVADGEISATSNQAVNGSQLFATNARVSTNTTNLSNVASSLGAGAGIAADGTWTAPNYAVQGGNYANVGAALGALDVATTGNSTAINNLQAEINNGGLGLVKQDATTRDNHCRSGDRRGFSHLHQQRGRHRTLSGVTAALLSSTSTQAVNGSQLYAANNTLVNILGGSAALDGNGNITGPTWTIQGTTTNNISQALASLDSSVNDLKREAQSGGGKIVTQPGTKDTVSVGGHTGGSSVSLTGQDGDRTLTGVANGVNDNDAVTVAQLNALSREVVAASKQLAVNVSDSVTPASATGADSIALGGNANSSGTNAISIGNGAAASGSGSSAVGASSSASGTNATAMGQNSNASGTNSVALGSSSTASGSNSVALGANSVASRDNSVSVGAAGSERQITNVAAGTQTTDAVNLGQLNSAQQQNNRAFSQLSRRIDRVENKLTAGICLVDGYGGDPAGIPAGLKPGRGSDFRLFGQKRDCRGRIENF
ncbi:Adhesin yadA precursor [Cedecea neteri]|uniref:Adhesin yadA n=1 Tax=Cedecea neteri TaxID=158822 RepID=A0A2X3ILX9_9ENTR|nr:Adhesin yadA precursor [Cedecea neteri]